MGWALRAGIRWYPAAGGGVDLHRVSGAQCGDSRRWGDDRRDSVLGASAGRSVSLVRPPGQLVADDDGGHVADRDERAVGQAGPPHRMRAPLVGAADDPLAVQLPVHLLRRRRRHPESLSPGALIGEVVGVAAFRARTVPGREGDGLIVEVQEGVVVR
jgi:hypothetical protein